MNEGLPGYRTTSARRGRSRSTLLTAAIAILAAVTLVLMVLQRDPQPPRQPQPSSVARDPAPSPPSPPTATATATVLIERSSEWVVAVAPTTTPTPWPTLAPPATATARPSPSPTPLLSQCVSFRWSARQVFTPSAQVMVEIEAVNRCRRELGPLELWFEITGWRQGGQVQSVRGHPFDRIRPGMSEVVAIGLPGSIDWYDEITVEILD
jgi:hypothetical protein